MKNYMMCDFDNEVDAWGYSNDLSDNEIEALRDEQLRVRVRGRIVRAMRKARTEKAKK